MWVRGWNLFFSANDTSQRLSFVSVEWYCWNRIVDRVHTLRRALGATEAWRVRESGRLAERAKLKQRKKDVVKALAENAEQVVRVQQEKLKVMVLFKSPPSPETSQSCSQGALVGGVNNKRVQFDCVYSRPFPSDVSFNIWRVRQLSYDRAHRELVVYVSGIEERTRTICVRNRVRLTTKG